MATVPPIYTNNIPIQNIGGLTPLQLAAANYMMSGSPQPFGINKDFLTEMVIFGSSENISPLEFDPRTGLPNPFPPLIRDVTAEYYFVRGEDLYIYRRAENCGPDENRFEEVLVGKVRDVATGTYAYYGRIIRPGSAATGGGGGDGSGGDGGFTPGPAPDTPSGLNDTNTTTGDFSNGYGSTNSFA
jgi:hypothetical protein